jgi:hypothetical protein
MLALRDRTTQQKGEEEEGGVMMVVAMVVLIEVAAVVEERGPTLQSAAGSGQIQGQDAVGEAPAGPRATA